MDLQHPRRRKVEFLKCFKIHIIILLISVLVLVVTDEDEYVLFIWSAAIIFLYYCTSIDSLV